MSRIGRAALGVALILPGIAEPTTAAAAACAVTFKKSDYTGGFTAAVTVLNTGTETINGWTFRFPLDLTATVAELWNAELLSASGTIVARDRSWNAVVTPGNSINIGFRAVGASAVPAGFSVNDLPCQVA